MVYWFWYPIEIRYQWLGSLIVVPIFMLFRLLAYKRLFTRFPLDIWLVVFLILGVLNLYLSPFTAANPMSRLYLLARPLLGIALCIYFVEYARIYSKLDGLLFITLLLSLLIGAMALLSSDWNNKSDQLRFIIDLIPRFDKFPGAVGGFNANEIAGGLTWIVPLCAGLMFWRGSRKMDTIIRWGFIAAFVISFTALYLGQSRSAIAGVLVILVPMIYFLVSRWRWRIVAWVIIGALIVLELMIVRNVFTPPGQPILAQRDEASVDGRVDIWKSALKIISDHPLTGVGMNMFREKVIRNLYPVPTFLQPVLPHAHNEFLQIATDLGLPGLLVFIIWYGVTFWSLLRVYRLGEMHFKVLAIAIAGGLLAHIAFGMSDAVAIWDRLAFLLWWMFALSYAVYWLARHISTPSSLKQG
ncbi:MAG: O-antigen ligase family protein [Anaerolineae bacterium]|nr:O-antigen ligase family protein [Anaerolineae bacterium]